MATRRCGAASRFSSFLACAALLVSGSEARAQGGFAWGVRTFRHRDHDVRVDEAKARRALWVDVEPATLRPAERLGAPGRPIYASYAEAIANEGTLAITPSLLEGKVQRFWLQAEIAFERARIHGLGELDPMGWAIDPSAGLSGLRALVLESYFASARAKATAAAVELGAALRLAGWPLAAVDAPLAEPLASRSSALRRELAARPGIGAQRSGSWRTAARALDVALAMRRDSDQSAWLDSAAAVLRTRPMLISGFQRWAALDLWMRGEAEGGGVWALDGAAGGAFLERPAIRGWTLAAPSATAGDPGAWLAEDASRARGYPGVRWRGLNALWGGRADEASQRLDAAPVLNAFARSAVRASLALAASEPRVPRRERFASLPVEVPEEDEELWIRPLLGALPHLEYLRTAADGYRALGEELESLLGEELATSLRCWTYDAAVGLDVLSELRHLEDLHRGTLAWVCEDLGLDWRMTGEEKLYRAIGGRDLAERWARDLGEDPVLRGDLRRVVVDGFDGEAFECYGCVGVAVWRGELRYTHPPEVTLYDESGRELEPGRVAVRFQDSPIRLPHEIWVRFRALRPPSDAEWSAMVAASRDLEALRAELERLD